MKKENGMSEGKRIRQLAAEAKAKRLKKEKEIAKKKNKKLATLFEKLASSLYKEVLAAIKEDVKRKEIESYQELKYLGKEPYLEKSQQKKVVDLLVKKLEADGFKAKAKWEFHHGQYMTDECWSEEYFSITIKF